MLYPMLNPLLKSSRQYVDHYRHTYGWPDQPLHKHVSGEFDLTLLTKLKVPVGHALIVEGTLYINTGYTFNTGINFFSYVIYNTGIAGGCVAQSLHNVNSATSPTSCFVHFEAGTGAEFGIMRMYFATDGVLASVIDNTYYTKSFVSVIVRSTTDFTYNNTFLNP